MSLEKNIFASPEIYDAAAVIVHEASQGLMERLSWLTMQPQHIVELGSGVGALTKLLLEQYTTADVLAIDLSEPMLNFIPAHPRLSKLQTDVRTLSLQLQSTDMLLCNLLLSWLDDPRQILQRWQSFLRPHGVIAFSMLGLDTLKNTRELFGEIVLPHLIDMHDVGDMLLQLGFLEPVLDVEYYTITYRDPYKMFAELQASGMVAQHLQLKNPPPANANGMWEVTYEVIYAHAFASAQQEFAAKNTDEIRVPLHSLKRQLNNG